MLLETGIWAGSQHFQQDCMCAQRSLRSACACAKSGICAVLLKSLWIMKASATHRVLCDQTARMRRLIYLFAGRMQSCWKRCSWYITYSNTISPFSNIIENSKRVCNWTAKFLMRLRICAAKCRPLLLRSIPSTHDTTPLILKSMFKAREKSIWHTRKANAKISLNTQAL